MAIDPISAILETGSTIIDKIWPDADEADKRKLQLAEIAHSGDMARLQAEVKSLTGQLEINRTEAQHKSVFVAGWRPACGWVGALSLAYAAAIEPVARFICVANGIESDLPQVDTTITMQVLFGMLGLGAYRTYEKKKRVQSDSLSGKK